MGVGVCFWLCGFAGVFCLCGSAGVFLAVWVCFDCVECTCVFGCVGVICVRLGSVCCVCICIHRTDGHRTDGHFAIFGYVRTDGRTDGNEKKKQR